MKLKMTGVGALTKNTTATGATVKGGVLATSSGPRTIKSERKQSAAV